MPVAPLRPASTVVVLRAQENAPGFEVLLVRRNDQVAFMAGAFVFPGGRVDEGDHLSPAAGDKLPARRFSDLNVEQERAHRMAAKRELEEEAGVTVELGDLEPFAHWVTPEIETRRYDTRFFVARMPAGQEARADAGETTELAWLSPRDALARSQAQVILLPPPTWTTLKQLQRHPSIEAVFAWAQRKPIVRIEPRFLREEERTMLTLPGDPTYPTVDGWEVPDDTRFLLAEGRWQPVRA
ncbi:MAG: NUDIX hydrolase [Acidobacteriota bacterium]